VLVDRYRERCRARIELDGAQAVLLPEVEQTYCEGLPRGGRARVALLEAIGELP
jgi:hypothetical protein